MPSASSSSWAWPASSCFRCVVQEGWSLGSATHLGSSSDERRLQALRRAHQVRGCQLELQPALAAIDVDIGLAQYGGLDRRAQPALLAEGADTADLVAREPFRLGHRQHGGALAAERRRHLLHAGL